MSNGIPYPEIEALHYLRREASVAGIKTGVYFHSALMWFQIVRDTALGRLLSTGRAAGGHPSIEIEFKATISMDRGSMF